ncbi:LOW QUALITY PROTEIN: hypothetical protein BC936DRAFT_143489 [Jimgerdemannia flammicorona]|uniref:Uncharacterized protein n=1 Tax=Jimgerdemannia flammicorona TaxID=994334 RepID=A0A432ZZB9_9FUNG|nr:LOW QUALITY PROTEIN: hypothetical protein BC936DRAFT_143489 [Jimgerdemannia flammicorona]
MGSRLRRSTVNPSQGQATPRLKEHERTIQDREKSQTNITTGKRKRRRHLPPNIRNYSPFSKSTFSRIRNWTTRL